MNGMETGSLWHDFADRLRAFVAGRVPAQDADDVAQDVMLRMQKGIASLRDEERAESWVYGIARRAIADYFRARITRLKVESGGEVDDAPDLRVNGEANGDVHEQVLTWLRPFAEGLPDGYREALMMADFDGHSQQSVATALGLSLSGAKSRIQRARKMLGESLRHCCELHFGADGRVRSFDRRECGCNC